MSVLSALALKLRLTARAPPALRLRVLAAQGPAGRDGKDGEPGPPGSASSTAIIAQAQPAAVWTLAHGLGRFPSVTLVDSAGDEFAAGVRYVDSDTIVVTLAAPVSGVAYLN